MDTQGKKEREEKDVMVIKPFNLGDHELHPGDIIHICKDGSIRLENEQIVYAPPGLLREYYKDLEGKS